MSEEKEQRVWITFGFKLGKNGAETFEMLKTAFGDERVSRARTFEWFKKAELQSTTIRATVSMQKLCFCDTHAIINSCK